jgi:nucleoside-diphosphate-sugar epimerase
LNKRILVTGANGFVGSALTARLRERGMPLRAALRRDAPPDSDQVDIGDIDANTDWSRALEDVACVVHLAAHAHRMSEQRQDERLYRTVNVDGARRLALQAKQAGVGHFILLSTAKVYGEDSGDGAFREQDAPRPQDDYAQSKLEAEQAVNEIFADGRTALTILRPPLVYGPGVAANFLRMLEHVSCRRMLPLGAVRNKRSLLGLGNLLGAVELCIERPATAPRLFNLSDDEALSTPEIIRRLAAALGVRPNLANMPVGMLRVAAQITGFGAPADRLLGNFAVDSSLIRATLGWQPRPVDEELAATAEWFRKRNTRAGGR